MKNVLILVAVVLVAAGAYWKFRDKIHGKIEDVKKADEKGSGGVPSIIPSAKNAASEAVPKADDKLPLVSAEFIRGLPDSLTTITAAAGAKPGLVVELTLAAESGGGLPPQIQLTPNVALDTSATQLPSGAKEGATVLVHLQSVNAVNANVSTPQYVVQGAAAPIPPALESGIRAQRWRSTNTLPVSSMTRPALGAHLWATEFAERAENNLLQGVILVEGTFAKRRRASGNAKTEVVTLEETKDLEFHVPHNSSWIQYVVDAEKQKAKGHKVTLKMSIDTSLTPKYFVQQVQWGIPVKAKFVYWNQLFIGKKRLTQTLALAQWAELRGLHDEAEAMYETARQFVTRDSLNEIGRPVRAVRIHLADEADDHWFYEKVAAVSESSHNPIFDGKPSQYAEDFQGAASPFCAVLKTNPNGETTGGHYYLLQK